MCDIVTFANTLAKQSDISQLRVKLDNDDHGNNNYGKLDERIVIAFAMGITRCFAKTQYGNYLYMYDPEKKYGLQIRITDDMINTLPDFMICSFLMDITCYVFANLHFPLETEITTPDGKTIIVKIGIDPYGSRQMREIVLMVN
jgi:hypothetical protein